MVYVGKSYMALAERHARQADLTEQQTAAASRAQQPVERGANQRRIIGALLLVTAVKQLALALAYPPFQGHDEVAHLGYERVLADAHRLPTFSDRLPASLEPYSRYTLDWPALYSANHPPLYYVLAWPFYRLAGANELAQLYAMRLLAVPLFLLTVWCAWQLATTLFPGDVFLALTVPAAIAFQPQLSFEGAIVNNDVLASACGALLLWLAARALRRGLSVRLALALGVTLGLGLLSKATLTVFLPLVGGVAAWVCWPRPWRSLRTADWWRATMPRAAALVGPSVLLPLPWYLHLKHTYGDFTAFHATQELQRNWNHPAGTFTGLLTSGSFHLERLRETWGDFGWKLLPLDTWELRAVYLGTALCGVGMLVGLGTALWQWRATRRLPGAAWQPAGVVFLLAAWVLLYGAMLYFGTMFLLTQARYVFPVAPAAALLAMLGLRALTPRRWRAPGAALVIGCLAAFQFLLLTNLVLPYAFF
jgi:4-amino-4-deoxy-L-arabinose transferase-like glycosyltransferase